MPDQPGQPQTFSAWEDVLEAMRGQVTPHQFRTWLQGVTACWEGDERLVLDAGSSFRAEVLSKRYADRIARTVFEVSGRSPSSISVSSGERGARGTEAAGAVDATGAVSDGEGRGDEANADAGLPSAAELRAALDSPQFGAASEGRSTSGSRVVGPGDRATFGAKSRNGVGSGTPASLPLSGERRQPAASFDRTLARIKRRREQSQTAGAHQRRIPGTPGGFEGSGAGSASCEGVPQAPRAAVGGSGLAAPAPQSRPAARPPVARAAEDPETPLNPEFRAEHWIEDESNRLATLAARSVTMSCDRLYNPLVIVGSIGVGKSHLCQMVVRDQQSAAPATRIRYATGEQFVNEFLGALERKAMSGFRSRFRSLDLLVIDDLESLAHKERSQLEFLNVLNNLTLGGRQIVVSLPAAPERIAGFSDQLKSRLSGGMVCRIELPDRELRTRLAAATAERLGEPLSEEVLRFIADSAARSSREVKGAAVRLVAQARFTKRTPDLEACTRALGDLVSAAKRRVHIGGVIDAVCEDYGVSRKDLEGRDRTRAICEPRQLCMTLARDLTPHSLAEIGSALGRRDHSTVLHGIERTRARLRSASDAELAARYARLKAVLDPTAQ